MATIEQRPDRSGYRVRWYALDRRQRSRKCPDKRTAIQLAAEIDRLRAIGIDWRPSAPRARATVAEVTEAYVTYRALHAARESRRVEAVHLGVAHRFLAERRITFLDELSRPLLDDLLGWLLRPGAGWRGATRQPESASRCVAVLLAMC